MKKLALLILFGYVGAANAGFGPIKHDLSPQYRVWKTSWLGTGTFSGVQIATQPIIFHLVYGSGTISAGNGDFTLLQSTGMTSMSSDASTKCLVPLDNNMNMLQDKIGVPWDALISTHSYFNKSGPANIGYEWDYLNSQGGAFNRYPND